MKIERDSTATMERWKNSAHRKPLILQGARQTGKTWAMREFDIQGFQPVETRHPNECIQRYLCF